MKAIRLFPFSALLLTALPTLTHALAPPTLKLHAGQLTAPSVDASFGYSLAASPRWIAVGEPGNDEQTLDGGAVHVFDARNGRHIRKLTAQDTVTSRHFGHTVSLWGDLLVVGAPTDNEVAPNSGAAYLFDLRSGVQLAKWTASDALVNARFGSSVAMSGDLALVGAWGDSALGIDAGAAYVFRLSTGTELHKLTASDAAAGHRFGLSVALQAGVAVIGAPAATGAVANSGAIYVFDAETGLEADKYFAAAGAPADFFGGSVALDGNLVMVGASSADLLAPNAGAVFFFDWKTGFELKTVTAGGYGGMSHHFGNKVALANGVALASAIGKGGYRGAVYRIDLRNGLVPQEILSAGGKPLDFFGEGLAISGNQVFIGAPYEDDLAPNAGAVHWLRGGLAATLPLHSQLRTGNAAPGAPGTIIARLGSASINPQGMVMLDANLRGTGTQGGRTQGLWSSLGAADVQSLLLQRQDDLAPLGADFAGTFVSRATGVALNQSLNGVLRAQLRGPGVGRFNNQAVLLDSAAGLLPVVRTGRPLGLLGGASLRSVGEVTQNRNVFAPRIAMLCRARLEAGLVSPSQDSGLVFADGATGLLMDATAFEGRPAPDGGNFGQFSPRVAMREDLAVFCSRRILPSGSVPALFRRLAGVWSDTVVDAGVAAPDAGGAVFRNFVGESINDLSQVVLRATLTGAGVTGRNNEGIWHQGVNLVARRGEPIPSEASGVTWRRFLGFWPVADNGLIIHAVAAGPGYRPNQTGLWLRQENGTFLRLMRAGDVVGTDGARVRRLLRVDVDASTGAYTVLTSLTGSAARNQALFTGSLSSGHPVDLTSLRKPRLKLRKGVQLMSEGSAPVVVRGLSLPVTTDRAGAGAKGLGDVVNARGQVALRLLRSDRSIEIVRCDDVTLNP